MAPPLTDASPRAATPPLQAIATAAALQRIDTGSTDEECAAPATAGRA
ncbi:hypothetical protein V8246_11015 [Pseudoxanthomonas sp. F11]